jgi:hypothetical protein
MGLAPAVVPRSDDEARVFLKDAVPDDGRALAQYRAWLSPALDGASLGRLYADLFGRPLQHDVDVAGSFQDVLHRTLEGCAQRGRPLVQLLARAVRARADRKEIVEQLATVLGLAPVIEIAGLLARHGCPETLCGEMAQAMAIDRDASYLGHGHTGRAAWIDALVWLEELPAAAGWPPPLLDYLERLTTAWSASHDSIPVEIARWLDDHRGPRKANRGDAPPGGASGPRAPGQQTRPASIPSSARYDASVRYDVFLAHSPGGRPSARALYSLLQGQIRMFLAERSIPPGDRWDREIAAAQRASRATAILITQDADDSWYLGDEIVTAIALHRAAPDTHRIIPVLLAQGVSVPYGLSHVQVLDASGDTLPSVAHRLRAIVASPIRASTSHPTPKLPTLELPTVAPTPAAGGDCDHRRLHARLTQLTDTFFEEILFLAPIPRAHIAPTTAPLATRILHVAQLAAVNQALCRRLAELLDERAPWTRGDTT